MDVFGMAARSVTPARKPTAPSWTTWNLEGGLDRLRSSAARRVLLAGGESINKREDNIARDKRLNRQLRRQGRKVIRVWLSLFKNPPNLPNAHPTRLGQLGLLEIVRVDFVDGVTCQRGYAHTMVDH
jgi:hypothetical protein